MSFRAELGRFAAVGAIGFGVDGAILQSLVSAAGWSPLAARLVSFPVALTATFLLNRAWTFRHRAAAPAAYAYGAYSAIQILGALLNFGVFSACIAWAAGMPPLVALAIGAAIALVFNFSATRLLVFR